MLSAGVGVQGARVRRRWPGRLGFGTFEAWCQARVSEGGLLCGLVGSGGGRVEPGVWAGAGGVPASGGLQYKGVAQRGGLWCDALAEAGVREFEAARSRVPPSLGAVVRYFEEALGEAPVHEESGRFRFERWEGFPWGASWRRCLVSGGGSASVCLEWWANDDFGVSELREFFEAPFFELSESMVFHQWLGEGGWHWGVLRGARLAMGVLARGDYVYVRIRWWQPPV